MGALISEWFIIKCIFCFQEDRLITGGLYVGDLISGSLRFLVIKCFVIYNLSSLSSLEVGEFDFDNSHGLCNFGLRCFRNYEQKGKIRIKSTKNDSVHND